MNVSKPNDVTVTQQAEGYGELTELMSVLLGCYLSIPVTLLGTIGNAIIILVLTRQKNKDTNTIILLSLACCDLYFVMVQFTRKLGCLVEMFDPAWASYYSAYFTVSIWITGRYGLNCSVSHITLIGVERYIAVYYPFKVSVLISRRKLYIGLACLYIAGAAMMMPGFALFAVNDVYSAKVNRTLPMATYSELYHQGGFVYDWFHSFNMIAWSLIINPLNTATVLFLSLSVALKVRSLSKDRSKLTSGKTNNVDIRSTLMSLSISMVSLISMCPIVGFNIYMYFQPTGNRFSFIIFYDIEEFVNAINSSVNFLIFTSLSTKFNAGLKELFYGCRARPKHEV